MTKIHEPCHRFLGFLWRMHCDHPAWEKVKRPGCSEPYVFKCFYTCCKCGRKEAA